MRYPFCHWLPSWSILTAFLLSWNTQGVKAQDAQLNTILERLDRLEKENRSLQKTVQSQQEMLEHQEQLLKEQLLPSPTIRGGAVGGAIPITVPQSEEGDSEKREPLDKKPTAGKADGDKKEAIKPPEAPTTKSWDVGKARKVEGTWNNGLIFETEDKAFRMVVGGVNQFDMGWYGAEKSTVRSIGQFNNLVNPDQALQDGMDFRRARIRMSGTAYEQIEFFAQYEFANALDLRQRTLGIANPAGVATPNVLNSDPNETVGFNEVYIGLVKLPYVGNVRVGRHRESLNFVTATADNNQVWLERGLMFEAFNGNYNFSNGVTVSRNYLESRAYSLFGFFTQNNTNNRQFATVGDGNYVYDGRITFLPCWDEESQFWVHVGADYSYRNLYQDNVRYRARPNIRVGSSFQVSNLVDSGNLFSRDAQQILNLEFASVCGPWTFAAEGTVSWVTNAFTGGLPATNGRLPAGVAARGTYMAQGAYVELLRFLTPDSRPYVKERPGFGRVTPKNNFFFIEGDDGRKVFNAGAWEVGVRYDYVDLTHGGINGGMSQGITGAVNWYLSSNFRIQANYIWMDRDFNPTDNAGRQAGDLTGFGLRFNCDF